MASTIKVDNVQNQPGTNIVSKCSTTITLGQSGDTIALACGASQTGFGRTGTVDWQTGSIKTTTFTAVNGEGYFADTSGGAFTMNLPAGSAGAIVSVVDYTNTFQTNYLTVSPNGAEKIGGVAANGFLTIEGQSATFVYVDATEGWKNTMDSTSNIVGNTFVVASGGCVTTCGNFKIHKFTGPGTFCVAQVHPSAPNNAADWVVVAGGGGGGSSWRSGGGGAGGYRESPGSSTCYTASPLGAAPSAAVTLTATGYPIAVGGGGTGGGPCLPCKGAAGGASSFSIYPSAGGGEGGEYNPLNFPDTKGGDGGSGGGGGGTSPTGAPVAGGGAGNTPPVNPSQGFAGGDGCNSCSLASGGGGGGALNAGSSTWAPPTANVGGDGTTTNITGTALSLAGGGGGGQYAGITPCAPAGGLGGGGCGGTKTAPTTYVGGTDGDDNTGGGGGGKAGTNTTTASGSGGSGVVIIRYKYK